MGWGTGSSPTSVPCCRNRRISDSSVRPLSGSRGSPVCPLGRAHPGSRPRPRPGLGWPACPATPPASLVNADLLHLGNQHLQQPHDGLQRQLRLPGEDLGGRTGVPRLAKQSPRGSGTDLTPDLEPWAPQGRRHLGSSQQEPGNWAGPVHSDCDSWQGLGPLMERAPYCAFDPPDRVMRLGHLVSPRKDNQW